MRQPTFCVSDKAFRGISSFTLHLLAMAFMLCDHLWATIVPGHQWLTWLGRLSFPVYAFLIVEGYYHTHDFKKYLCRLLVFAVLSEIPFNLMYTASWVFPFHQNVLWTFVWSLLCMRAIDNLRERFKRWIAVMTAVIVAGLFMLIAQLTMTDYYGYGVLTVLVFYCFRGNGWPKRLGQLAGLIYINWYLIGGMMIPISILGRTFELPQQGIAILALLFIWCYRGRQGLHNKVIQYFFYAFYPVHLLILGLVSL